MSRNSLAGKLAVASAIVVVALSSSTAAAADTYPSRPVRFIVPFPPGGGTDILARLVGEGLSQSLKRPFVIDNRPGAGTNIGMEAAARAVPDGHTIIMASIGLSANPHLYPKLTFDPIRDLAPVSLVAIAPTILAVHPSVQAQGPQDLLKLLRAQPGRLNYGSFGSGSGAHLAAELFKLVTKTDIVHIPYKGGCPAITALLGGEVQMVFSSLLPMLPHIQSGRVRPIGLAAGKRFRGLPNVTTFKEAGVDYETGTWFGVLAPRGTPQPILERLHREVATIVRSEEAQTRISREGAEPIGGSPAEFGAFIAAESRRWAEVVKRAGITVD